MGNNMSSTIYRLKLWAQYFITRLTAVLLLSLPFHLAQAADTVYAATAYGLSISSDGGASFSWYLSDTSCNNTEEGE
jgi:hypothetical protein